MSSNNEFDNLSDAWGKMDSSTNADLAVMIEKTLAKSKEPNTVFTKLKRSFCVEIISGFIISPLLIAYAIYDWSNVYGAIFLLSLGILFLTLVSYNLIKFQKIRSINLIGSDLKGSLTELINKTERFIVFYRNINLYLGLILIIPSLLYGFQLGAGDSDVLHRINLVSIHPIFWIFIAIFIAVFIIAYVYFIKFYVKKMYGRHVDKLKTQLSHLTEEETANQ
ncbi:MAG TPA: hypothetical protein PLC17_02660 [Tenuifilaceae bacterium]|nr:hypothetical protein [Tenuifilaceae bacterium]